MRYVLSLKDIQELIGSIDKTGITHFEYESSGQKLSIRKEKSVVSPQPPAPGDDVTEEGVTSQEVSGEASSAISEPPKEEKLDEDVHEIVSPMVGTFYRAPAPDAEPYVQKGDVVQQSTVVCIVEAMKLMNEIEAEVNGEIVDILAENGQLVEYGQPLFLVKPV
jgi:acetyl-CoA carboxylase biotin carboxyl carrier protein